MGETFRFASFNVPRVLSINGQVPIEDEQEDAVKSIAGLQGRVLRTGHLLSNLVLNETLLLGLDTLLDLCRRNYIRVVIPLFDPTFLPLVLNNTKNTIQSLLNRVNLVNGIQYKQDPTILAWQITTQEGIAFQWIQETALLIKQSAPNTLIMAYPESPDISNGFLADANIDILSLSLSSQTTSDLQLLHNISTVLQSKKVIVIDAIGGEINYVESLLDAAYRNPKISGVFVDSLDFHSKDGGFYTGGYHVPGFNYSKGFSQDDLEFAKMARNYSLKMKGYPLNVLYPIPRPLKRGGVNGKRLWWMGSAWAQRYHVLAFNLDLNLSQEIGSIEDGLASGQFYFEDTITNVTVNYAVLPESVNGDITRDNPLVIPGFA
ncbi:hypothetical protein EDD86DRAFT_190353 [Gorgonomyces haynaldii]|nr:hypothetical protein EDD86DRAFT_190353 [Gorgonomyces haynaldii]